MASLQVRDERGVRFQTPLGNLPLASASDQALVDKIYASFQTPLGNLPLASAAREMVKKAQAFCFKPLSGIYLWPAVAIAILMAVIMTEVSNPSREFTSGQRFAGVVVREPSPKVSNPSREFTSGQHFWR